jgi:hypothetical protein
VSTTGTDQPVSNDEFGLVRAHPIANLQDHEPGHRLAGDERRDVDLGAQFDADDYGGTLGRGDAWQVDVHGASSGQ